MGRIMDDSFDVYSVSGLNHDVQQDVEIGHSLDHIRDACEWNYDRTFNYEGVNYLGIGPKNYWPDDERIYEKVCERLFRDHLVDASEIEVKVDKGTVTLKGLVSDRNAKRNAEKCIENVFGVVDVQNNLQLKTQRGLIGSSDGWPV